MTLFEGFIRRWTIRKYRKKLGPLLRKRYGLLRSYTIGQIRTTVEQAGLPTARIYYAYAMFATENEFNSQRAKPDRSTRSYTSTRQEIGDVSFSGDPDFSVSDAVASPSGGSADSGGGGGDSSGS